LLQAVARDPKFARGYSRLAAVESVAMNYFPEALDELSAAAEEHARIAIALDPGLAEPYAARGQLYLRQRRFQEAGEQYEKALVLDPNDVTSNFWYGTFLAETGYQTQANQQFDKTLAIDPLMPNALIWRGQTTIYMGDPKAAVPFIERAAETGIAHIGLAQSDLAAAQGDPKRAARELATAYAVFAGGLPTGSAQVLADAIFGDAQARIAADKIAKDYLAGKHGQISAPLLDALLRGGQAPRALGLLSPGPSANDAMIIQRLWSVELGGLRKTPEFANFLTASGLTKLWDARGNPDLCKRQPDGHYACN
jgi:tetratricopeptide (TPR) repeat protein